MTSAVVSNLLMGWNGILPVDPTQFAAENGISVRYDQSLERGGLSGYSDPEDNTIYVNPNESWSRKRFTVAHELGHCLLGHGARNRRRDALPGVDSQEVEANNFAAELLMPEDAVKQLAPGNSLQMMAWYFDVSTTAMYFRMKNLGLA